MKRRSLMIGGVATLVAIAVVAILLSAFFYFFEYHKEVRDLGMSKQARQNQYLAAERFLKHFGMKSRVVGSMLKMKSLPPTDDVLLIPTNRYDLSQEKTQALMSWVKNGGHLILRARRSAGNDELLAHLGIKTEYKKIKKLFEKSDYAVIDVHVSKGIENKKVSFDIDRWLKNTGKNTPSWYIESKNGNQLLEYRYGEGYITVLSDFGFMLNKRIAQHDNAAFLYTLVHMKQENHALWIVVNDDMPSLISIIKNKAPASVISLLILIVIWLWYTTRRFGPLLIPVASARRSLREHITASGLYQWRNKNRTNLFMSARSALMEQLAQSRPQWIRLEKKELADKLAQVAGISPESILTVLLAKTADKENEFTQYIEILSKIRKHL